MFDQPTSRCPTFDSIYVLFETELEALRAYIIENVEKGFIQPSNSSIGAPILFIEKDRSLDLNVNYHDLNKITIRNH